MLKEAIQHAIQLFPLLSRQNHVTSQFLASSCICTACNSISASGIQDLPYNALQGFETYRQAACDIYSAARRDAVMFFFLFKSVACWSFTRRASCKRHSTDTLWLRAQHFQFLFSAINIFYHQLPMPWDDTTIVKLRYMRGWFVLFWCLLSFVIMHCCIYVQANDATFYKCLLSYPRCARKWNTPRHN